MVTAEEVATSQICVKLRGVQHFCVDSGEVVPTIIVKINELAPERVEIQRQNANLSECAIYMKGKSVSKYRSLSSGGRFGEGSQCGEGAC